MPRYSLVVLVVAVVLFHLIPASSSAQDPAAPAQAGSQTEYKDFLAVLAALSKLVLLSIILERGLAFVFEHEWFVRLTTTEVADPKDANKKVRQPKWPGVKGLITLGCSTGLCFYYSFDLMSVVFGTGSAEPLGKLITALVAAGGSAGAIAAFQGFLNWNKQSRDAAVEARKAEAEAAKLSAEAAAAGADARKEQAEADKAEAEARKAQAEATKERAQADQAEIRKRAAGGGG